MSRRSKILRDIVSFIVMVIIAIGMTPIQKNYVPISYANFKTLMEQKDINRITYFTANKYAIINQTSTNSEYKVSIISSENFENDIYEYSLIQKELNYSLGVEPINIGPLPKYFAMLLAFVIIRLLWKAAYLKMLMRRIEKGSKDEKKKAQKEVLSLGFKKSSAPNSSARKVEDIEVTFKDVIGLEKQIEEFQEIVDFLRNPGKYSEMGARLPRGVLLYGKPGVGKTYIARAIAGEAEVPFFEISASEFQAKYLGESEERIRALFDEASREQPSIVYIDEIDSIAAKRFSDYSNKYSASIVNQLLACMDGFSKDSEVIVIASTNHLGELDDALLRNGRFDKKIYIHEPDKEARRKLFEYYSQDKLIDDTIDLDRFLEVTAGLTGADIKTILNEAALLAVRSNAEFISEDILMEAFRKVEIGSENNFTTNSEESLRRTAIHESGHAVVSHYFGQKISEISIISRGNAAGYNLYANDDASNYGFTELKHKIMCLLAGRAAEELVYNEVSAGASDDLMRASSIIRDMYLKFSMRDNPDISLVLTDDPKFNEMVARSSFENMNEFFKSCYKETLNILNTRKKILINLADELVDKETLSTEEIEVALNG